MKLYLTARILTASEKRLNYLKNKYSESIKTFLKEGEFNPSISSDQIIKAAYDLSIRATKTVKEEGKPEYAEWICKMILNKSCRIGRLFSKTLELEDGNKLYTDLQNFHSLKTKKKFKEAPIEGNPDISTYKKAPELSIIVDKALKILSPLKESDIKATVGRGDVPGAETLYNDSKWVVYYVEGTKPSSVNALVQLSGKVPGEDRRLFTCTWCTDSQETSKDYLSQGPLLVIFKNGEPVAQLHGATDQFMDKMDRNLGIEKWRQWLKPVLKKISKEKRVKVWKVLSLETEEGERILSINKSKEEPEKPSILERIKNLVAS